MIATDGTPFHTLRRVSRETLNAVGLADIPEGSIDIDLFLGEPAWVGKGVGPTRSPQLYETTQQDW